jgi:Transcription factor S-II (TFIIS)
VFGGPGAWDNADKAKMQCPRDGCDGEEAAFFQVQIRSADEPMTGFYKVSLNWSGRMRKGTNGLTVYDLWASVERELSA